MGAKRTPDQREADLVLIADWYCRGLTQREIAAKLATARREWGYTISHQQISADLETIRERWRAMQLESFGEAQAREMAKIDHLERVYWSQFETSKRTLEHTLTQQDDDLVVATTTLSLPGQAVQTTSQPVSGRRRAQIKHVQRDGDAEWLRGVQWCIDRRIKLLGLDAAQTVEIMVRREAEEAAHALGLDPQELIKEAQAILRGAMGPQL